MREVRIVDGGVVTAEGTSSGQQPEHQEKTAKSFAPTAALTNQLESRASRDADIALDALIDEKVFGYTWQPVSPEDIAGPTVTHRLYKYATGDGHIRAERHTDGRVTYLGGREYSRFISHAWRVVDEMHRRNYDVDLGGAQRPHAPGVEWEAVFGHPELDAGCAFADTAPLAICRAALAAVRSTGETEGEHAR